MERLDRLDDPRVKLAAALLQQAAVGHLVRERVLERVLEIREEPGLVEELGGLQVVEPARSASSGSSAIAWSSANGTSLPMTEATWSRRLSSGAAGRCGRPASPGPWPGPGSRGLAASADTGRAPPPAPWSPPASGRSPPGRTGCPSPDEELLERCERRGRHQASASSSSPALSAGSGSSRSWL